MDVTIVVPVYRNEETIGRTLTSIDRAWQAAGAPDGLRTIVVVDGIVDSSIDIIEEWSKVTGVSMTLVVQGNGGVGSARNTGWTRSQSQWVTFLDADDEITVERLRYAETGLESNVAYVGCQVLKVDAGLRIPGMPERFITDQGVTRFHFISMLVERSTIEAVGGFDETFHAGNDWDFAVRLAAQGITIEYVDQPFLVRHIHGDNMTMDESAVRRDYLRAIRQHRKRRGSPHQPLDPS